MKKIIAAFDGLKFSQSTKEYALYIAKQTNTHLVGVFLDDSIYTSYKIADLITKEGVSESRLEKLAARDRAFRSAAAGNFDKACQQLANGYSIHHDRKIATQELKHESVYADLLIIDANETFTHYTESAPTHFIRDLLTDAQCPVLVVPRHYKTIQKIIWLFDGEPSSVHAVKMFSYLLPQLKHLETEVISVKPMNGSLHMPDNKLMKEFMKRHYPYATYTVLKGWADVEIINHLKGLNENALVVLGAYGRGVVSRLFRESMADALMKEMKLPLFIAHNK